MYMRALPSILRSAALVLTFEFTPWNTQNIGRNTQIQQQATLQGVCVEVFWWAALLNHPLVMVGLRLWRFPELRGVGTQFRGIPACMCAGMNAVCVLWLHPGCPRWRSGLRLRSEHDLVWKKFSTSDRVKLTLYFGNFWHKQWVMNVNKKYDITIWTASIFLYKFQCISDVWYD